MPSQKYWKPNHSGKHQCKALSVSLGCRLSRPMVSLHGIDTNSHNRQDLERLSYGDSNRIARYDNTSVAFRRGESCSGHVGIEQSTQIETPSSRNWSIATPSSASYVWWCKIVFFIQDEIRIVIDIAASVRTNCSKPIRFTSARADAGSSGLGFHDIAACIAGITQHI